MGFFGNLISKGASFLGNLFGKGKNLLSNVIGKGANLVSRLAPAYNKAKDVVSSISSGASRAKAALDAVKNGAAKWGNNAVTRGIGNATSKLGGLASSIGSGATTLGDHMEDLQNRASAGLSNVAKAGAGIGDLLGKQGTDLKGFSNTLDFSKLNDNTLENAIGIRDLGAPILDGVKNVARDTIDEVKNSFTRNRG
jgi:hypothetical protein